jgi:uncharacterized protein (TIRG00374 family)
MPSLDDEELTLAHPKPRSPTRIWLRRALSLALLGLLLYFFWPLLGEIKAAANLFLTADWFWFGAAVIIQGISYGFLTWLNALSLQPFSGKIDFIPLAGVLTSMAFIAVAVPSAGISGIAMRVHLLGKYDYLPEEALFSMAVESILEMIALASVALIGVAYLIRSGGLATLNILGLILLGLLVIFVVWFSWRVISDYERSKRVVNQFVGLWNKYGQRIKKLDLENADERLIYFHENLRRFPRSSIWKFPLSAYGKVILDVITLGVCFKMFGYMIPLETLFIGYGLTLALSGLTALPGGLVMTDAFVVVIFSKLGVPGSVALAGGLTYRLIAFWLVRFAGYLSWLVLEKRK